MAKFKEHIIAEGKFWDALKIGVKAGVKAFNKKRAEQSKKDDKKLGSKIIDAEGKELESLIRQMVDDGYRVRRGSLAKSSKGGVNDWLMENRRNHVSTQGRHHVKEDGAKRSASPFEAKE